MGNMDRSRAAGSERESLQPRALQVDNQYNNQYSYDDDGDCDDGDDCDDENYEDPAPCVLLDCNQYSDLGRNFIFAVEILSLSSLLSGSKGKSEYNI